MKLEALYNKLSNWGWKNWFFSVFFLSLLFTLLMGLGGKKNTPSKPDRTRVDTFIPKGFVLVPIQIQNFESLDSVLGQYGVVDLYQFKERQKSKTKLIAKSIRLLRSPLNPNHFGVLAPENLASFILTHGPVYWAVLKNPSQGGTEIENEVTKTPRKRIYYE